MLTYEEILATNPVVDTQLPPPVVPEAVNGVIYLNAPFSVQYPVVEPDTYTEVWMVIKNDIDNYPQAVVQKAIVDGFPTGEVIDNDALEPPFGPEHFPRIIALLRTKEGHMVQTNDGTGYSFSESPQA